MKIINKDNLEESRESLAYKGPPGSGKTHNLASWPEPIKIAYFDRNVKTIRELIRGGLDAEVFVFDTFKEFEDEFVHKVLHREFEAATIGMDTIDFAAGMLMKETQGNKVRMTQADWGIILTKMRSVFFDLTSACISIPGSDKPSYNLVACYHMQDITDGDGSLLRTAPKIAGGFRDELEAYFDNILYCESKISSLPVSQPGGGTRLVPSKQFLCHSVPPNPFITCKGGGLPPVGPGDYASLRKEWDKKEATPSGA